MESTGTIAGSSGFALEIRRHADYQQFSFDKDGRIADVGARMAHKMQALAGVMPDWQGKSVLDIGCDFGFWSFLASQNGARVLGIDRSRKVRGVGFVDLPSLNRATAELFPIHSDCRFLPYECGINYAHLGWFDVVLCMSLYHHIYQNTGGDHEPIWYWLWRNMAENGVLYWENPLTCEDSVVRMNVNEKIHEHYNEQDIRKAVERYFEIVWEGPAVHEATRVLWLLRPKKTYGDVAPQEYMGELAGGAGGASKAFTYASGRRIDEIRMTLGISPIPGSLNVRLTSDFEWDRQYYRALIMDVKDRKVGLDGPWWHRPCRFYPLWADGAECFAMRFEGERYPKNFIELISDTRLRDIVSEPVRLEK